jgi:hypothetical protein
MAPSVTGSIQVLMKTHLWVRWAEIALAQRALARQGRQALLTQQATGSSLDITAEWDPAIISVAGSSHAIDAFYGEAKEFIAVPDALAQAWEKNRTGRPERIQETLKLGFQIGRHARRWKTEFDWLFDLRDAAVHHTSDAAPSVPHPVLPTNVSPEVRDYSVEAADRAVQLMLEVFATCLSSPRPALAELTKWATDLRPSVQALLDKA